MLPFSFSLCHFYYFLKFEIILFLHVAKQLLYLFLYIVVFISIEEKDWKLWNWSLVYQCRSNKLNYNGTCILSLLLLVSITKTWWPFRVCLQLKINLRNDLIFDPVLYAQHINHITYVFEFYKLLVTLFAT